MSDTGNADANSSAVDWEELAKARIQPPSASPPTRRWTSNPQVARGCVGAFVFLLLVTCPFVWPEWIFQTFGRRAYVIQLPDDPAPPGELPAGDRVRYGFRNGNGQIYPLRRDQILLSESRDRQGRHYVYLLPELEYASWAPNFWRAPHRDPIVPKNDGSIDRFDIYIGALVLHGFCAAILIVIGIVSFARRRGTKEKPTVT